MQTIFVDDNAAFVEALAGEHWLETLEADEKKVPVNPDQSPRQVAGAVAAQAADDDAVVFINVNLKCKGNARQDQAGVEVLKFLRLTERFNGRENEARDAHCVMYAFQRVEQLLRRKPSSLIVCSDGVTFEQLPSDFSELDIRELAEKKKANTSANSLDKFLRGEFTLPDRRHNWANWWGARQMLSLYFQEQNPDDIDLDEFVLPSENPQVRNALFLFGQNDASGRASSVLDRAEAQRNQLWGNLGFDPTPPYFPPSPSVGLIDDEAQRIQYQGQQTTQFGWQRICSRVLFDNDAGVVDLFDEEDIDPDEGDLLDLVPGEFRDVDFDEYACVLLDLRLRDDEEGGLPESVRDLSGARVLDFIREKHPTLPVIITTASNKIWNYEGLMELGADAYWIKEGLDEQRTDDESAQNYVRLLELVTAVTSEKYQLLRRFGKEIERLRARTKEEMLWWEKEREWYDPYTDESLRTPIGGREVVFQLLNDALLMLRSYLHQFEIGHGFQSDTHSSFWLGSIMQQLGGIIEVIHDWDSLDIGDRSRAIVGGIPRGNEYITRRGDWFGFRIYGQRNKAAHYASNRVVNWQYLKYFLANLLCYLHHDPIEGVTRRFDLEYDSDSRANERVKMNDVPFLRKMVSSQKYQAIQDRVLDQS
jgi:CheY-like chemotaxis protein